LLPTKLKLKKFKATMFSRKSEYGSPFFSMDSGRVSKDGENSQNINKILNNYGFFLNKGFF